MNEYEYYPNGDWHYKPVADRWALRVGRWVKRVAGHGHIVAIHNGPREPVFAARFAADPGAIDLILFQDWGTRDRENGWLATGIEEQIGRSFAGWGGAAIFAEWGYERNPDLPLLVPAHEWCDRDHSRRGAWRGAFQGLGLIHGFENTWGPWAILDRDQPGMDDFLHLRRFFTELVPFHELRPAQELLLSRNDDPECRISVLASADRRIVAAYLPLGRHIQLQEPAGLAHTARWFLPSTGELRPATREHNRWYNSPEDDASTEERPLDWVLLLTSDE